MVTSLVPMLLIGLAGLRTGNALSPVTDVSSSALRAEGEETVAVDPANPSAVVVGSNIFSPLTNSNLDNVGVGPSGTTECGVWSSQDGGGTWSGGRIGKTGLGPTQRPSLPGALREVPGEFDDPGNLISADQNTVFDGRGNAWYQCVYFGALTHDFVVRVYHSGDDGKTWDSPVVAFSEADTKIQIDRPFLAIDRSTVPATLYLTWETMFYQAWLPAVYMRSSTDGGAHWGAVRRVDEGTQQTMWDPRQYPVVGPDGTLYVVYDKARFLSPFQRDQIDTPAEIAVARLQKGAPRFSQHTVVSKANRAASPDEAFNYFLELIASIAADPSHPGRIAVAWPDDSSGEARILMRYSVDAGDTWSPVVDVNPGVGGNHDHVALAYLPDGRLVAVWRDRHASGGGWSDPWQIFARVYEVASDGTLTPGTAVEVTNGPQTPTTGTHGSMPSEYLGVAAGSWGLDVAWDQMSGTYPDNVYRRIPLNLLG